MPLYKSPSIAVMKKWKNKLICEGRAQKGWKERKNNKSGKFFSLFSICPTSHTSSVKVLKEKKITVWELCGCLNCRLCSAGCCLTIQDNGSVLSSFFAPLWLFKHLEPLLFSLSSLLCRSPSSALSHICFYFAASILFFHLPQVCVFLISIYHNGSLPSCLLASLFVYLIHVCVALCPVISRPVSSMTLWCFNLRSHVQMSRLHMNNPDCCRQKSCTRGVMHYARQCVHRWGNCCCYCLAQLYSTNSVLRHTHSTALQMRGNGVSLDPCIVSRSAKEPFKTGFLSFLQ